MCGVLVHQNRDGINIQYEDHIKFIVAVAIYRAISLWILKVAKQFSGRIYLLKSSGKPRSAHGRLHLDSRCL